MDEYDFSDIKQKELVWATKRAIDGYKEDHVEHISTPDAKIIFCFYENQALLTGWQKKSDTRTDDYGFEHSEKPARYNFDILPDHIQQHLLVQQLKMENSEDLELSLCSLDDDFLEMFYKDTDIKLW